MSFGKTLKFIMILGFGSLFLAACEQEPASEVGEKQSLSEFLTEATYEGLRDSPETISSLGLSEEEVGMKASPLLDDRSPAAEARGRARFEANLAQLQTYDRAELDETEQLYYDIAMITAEEALPLLDMEGPFSPNFPIYYRANQLFGPHLTIPQLLQAQHPVNNIQDAEDYIARLNAVGYNFEGFVDTWRDELNAGLMPPTFALEKMSATIDSFLGEDPKTNPLYQIFAGKLGALEGVTDEEKADLLSRAEDAIETSVKPGYAAVKALVEETIPQSSPEAGIWAKPGGEEFYRVAVRIFTGTDLSPEEIHEIGLAEVDRITGEMEQILADNGLTEGSRRARIQTLISRMNLNFTNDDAGREAVLAFLDQNKGFMTENVGDYFATIPEVDFEIQRIPEFQEASSPGGYYTGPTLDGSRPGIFWINLGNPSMINVPGLKSLLYHEAVPGHHFEVAQALTAADRPIFRRLYFSSNFSEGWGLYAERLAKEMGAYEGDPVGDLGRLGSELFRAVRLVVDTGMHAKQWTREEALTYMAEAMNAPEAGFVAEIERYAVMPGQALGYKMGMLKILELREKARQAMGENFDIKVFHDLILGEGSMPMPVVEKRVNEWIAEQG